MRTSKSPKRVLIEALRVGEGSLPRYAHRFSPKKFTLPQLFACLVLKDFYQLTYRGAVGLLADGDSLAAAIGLEQIPHWTTLQKAADRLLTSRSFRRLLTTTVERAQRAKIVRRRVRLAAVDASGFESHHASRYYAQRRKMTGKNGRTRRVSYRRYPKPGLVCDAASHFILAARASQGPRPDFGEFEPLLREAQARANLAAIAADAGFDSEANHQLARDELGIQSLIPALHGRQPAREPAGRYRKQMKRHLKQSKYSQRWQVETVNSMIKRLSGEVVNARTYDRRRRLLLLKTLTHNISILRRWGGFLLSTPDPFPSSANILRRLGLWFFKPEPISQKMLAVRADLQVRSFHGSGTSELKRHAHERLFSTGILCPHVLGFSSRSVSAKDSSAAAAIAEGLYWSKQLHSPSRRDSLLKKFALALA